MSFMCHNLNCTSTIMYILSHEKTLLLLYYAGLDFNNDNNYVKSDYKKNAKN